MKSSLSLTIAVFKSFWVLDGNFASNVSTTRRNKSTFLKDEKRALFARMSSGFKE